MYADKVNLSVNSEVAVHSIIHSFCKLEVIRRQLLFFYEVICGIMKSEVLFNL